MGKLKRLKGNRKPYARGDFIIAEVYKSYGEPSQLHLATLEPGDLFGELALFLREPRTATIMAGAGATVLEVRRSEVQRFIESNVNIAYQHSRNFVRTS